MTLIDPNSVVSQVELYRYLSATNQHAQHGDSWQGESHYSYMLIEIYYQFIFLELNIMGHMHAIS